MEKSTRSLRNLIFLFSAAISLELAIPAGPSPMTSVPAGRALDVLHE